jgi:hypothetical protein
METTQHFERKPVLRRHRSKMDGEDEQYWLCEAELVAKLAENARRLKILHGFLQIRPAEKASYQSATPHERPKGLGGPLCSAEQG